MVKTLGAYRANVNILCIWEGHEFREPEGRLLWVKWYPLERCVGVLNPSACHCDLFGNEVFADGIS